MNVGGGGKVSLTKNYRDDFDPAYSPDGSKIVYNHEGVNDTELYTIGVTTEGTLVGEPLKLTTNDTYDSSPSYSPKGDRIAYESSESSDGTDSVIYTIGVTRAGKPAAEPVKLTTTTTDDGSPSYSPTGDRIAYEGWDGSDWEIYTIGVTTEGVSVVGGGEPVQVTATETGDFNPSYSPDGTRIAYAGYDGNDYEILKITVDGRGKTPLTANEAEAEAEDLEPDWGIRPKL